MSLIYHLQVVVATSMHVLLCLVCSAFPHLCNSAQSKKASMAAVVFQWETYTRCMASPTTKASPSAS